MQQPTAAIELPGTHAGEHGGELEASAGGHSSPDTPPELRPITRNRQILVLISGFLTICITIGFNQSYGVFQNYYISPTQTMLPESTRNDGALVAFIGTLGYGLTWGGSIFVNPAMARLGVRGNRGLGILGVFFMSLGFLLASFSTQVSRSSSPICATPTSLMSVHSGLASPAHSRPSVRDRFFPAVLPHLERCPRVLHFSSRVRHGLHSLWGRGRWTCLLTSNPRALNRHRTPLDSTTTRLVKLDHLAAGSSDVCAIALHR